MAKSELLGPKSEKMPRVADELRKDEKADPGETRRKRRERSDSRKANLEQKTTVHAVPTSQRQCQCGRKDLKPLGAGKESIVYEYVPAHFVAHRHVPETLSCPARAAATW